MMKDLWDRDQTLTSMYLHYTVIKKKKTKSGLFLQVFAWLFHRFFIIFFIFSKKRETKEIFHSGYAIMPIFIFPCFHMQIFY